MMKDSLTSSSYGPALIFSILTKSLWISCWCYCCCSFQRRVDLLLNYAKQIFADIEQKSKFKCARKLHLRKKLGCWQLCYYHVSVLPLIRYFDRSAAQPPWGDDTTYYNVIRHNAAKTKHKYKYKYKMSNHHGAMTPPIIMSGLCL